VAGTVVYNGVYITDAVVCGAELCCLCTCRRCMHKRPNSVCILKDP
jgi:hypothetical protein